jgi:23S rRNA (uracil1939-C5)-methyltransferase
VTSQSASDELEAQIDHLGARGDGIAETSEGRLYVAGALPGERVRLRPDAARGDGRAAELVAVLEPATFRARPACPHFGDCGGCTLQHLGEPAYGTWKIDRIRAALARRGITDVAFAPLARSGPGSRRRVRFSAQRTRRGVVLGFHGRRSHRIVDIRTCPVAEPAIAALIAPLHDLLAVETELPDSLAVEATLLDTGLDVTFDLERTAPPGPGARMALAQFAEAQDLARLSLRSRGREEPLARRRAATIRFGAVTLEPPAGGFLQASRAGEAAIRAAVAEALPDTARRLADLFAGCGTLSLGLLDRLSVHAVESHEEAVAAMRAGADAAGLGGRVTTETRDLERRPLTAAELAGFDAAVFDPPRAGARAQAGELAQSDVALVVGVSCEPATFARDARALIDGGYRLERIVPVDQFHWSAHVELVAVFRR